MFYNLLLPQQVVIIYITVQGAIIYTFGLCGCFTIADSEWRRNCVLLPGGVMIFNGFLGEGGNVACLIAAWRVILKLYCCKCI